MIHSLERPATSGRFLRRRLTKKTVEVPLAAFQLVFAPDPKPFGNLERNSTNDIFGFARVSLSVPTMEGRTCICTYQVFPFREHPVL
ncbi:unnamed protein product [Discula destructiva]